MSKMLLAVVAFILVSLAALPLKSHAAALNAYSVIYFDTNNNIIGQEVLYCNNVAKYQGTIDKRSPYKIREEFGCGQVQVSCNIELNGVVCKPAGYNYGSWITYFNSATGLTQNNYCNNSPSTAFVGHPTCGLPAPTLVQGLGPIYNGFPPN
jgi:hypothetical protein